MPASAAAAASHCFFLSLRISLAASVAHPPLQRVIFGARVDGRLLLLLLLLFLFLLLIPLAPSTGSGGVFPVVAAAVGATRSRRARLLPHCRCCDGAGHHCRPARSDGMTQASASHPWVRFVVYLFGYVSSCSDNSAGSEMLVCSLLHPLPPSKLPRAHLL